MEVKKHPRIGLFGSCGQTKWRKVLIDMYNTLGIDYFNPQREDWNPTYQEEEGENLIEDVITLFAITKETSSLTSIYECLLKLMSHRIDKYNSYIVVYLEDGLEQNVGELKKAIDGRIRILSHLSPYHIPELVKDPFERDSSLKAKFLIWKRLRELSSYCMIDEAHCVKNLYVVDTIEEMLSVSIKLYQYVLTRGKARNGTLADKIASNIRLLTTGYKVGL